MTPDADVSDWFVATTPRPAAQVEVFAFPQAGAGCAVFGGHARALPESVEMATLNLPGRQARFGEPARTDLPGLVDDLTAAVRGGRPYVLFGYCSGALLAYLVACSLAERGMSLPRRLVVASYPAPGRGATPPLAALGSDELWDVLLANNAVPAAIAGHVELRALSEPAIRADFALVAGYRHRERPQLPIPVTVLRGARDGSFSAADAAGWSAFTSAGFRIREVAAGHWFMEEAPDVALAALAVEVRA